MKTIRLKLAGLNCGACVARTHKALAAVDGVEEAKVEVQSAVVEYSGNDPQKLVLAVEGAGYGAEIIG